MDRSSTMQRPVGPGPLATAHPASSTSSRTPASSSSSKEGIYLTVQSLGTTRVTIMLRL